jgi:hypothetical protein
MLMTLEDLQANEIVRESFTVSPVSHFFDKVEKMLATTNLHPATASSMGVIPATDDHHFVVQTQFNLPARLAIQVHIPIRCPLLDLGRVLYD